MRPPAGTYVGKGGRATRGNGPDARSPPVRTPRRLAPVDGGSGSGSEAVRFANGTDAAAVGRLLDEFNREFDDPTPGPEVLAQRIVRLLDGGDTTVLLIGGGPDGVAVLRFRAAIWSDALECYLAELYVVPERRGRGLGRALMHAAMDVARERGADYMELGTSETDLAARSLYESLGFSNREGKPDGPLNYFYEREL
jgi:ribosomal protein S18 acetylase RimI-like enzyme